MQSNTRSLTLGELYKDRKIQEKTRHSFPTLVDFIEKHCRNKMEIEYPEDESKGENTLLWLNQVN